MTHPVNKFFPRMPPLETLYNARPVHSGHFATWAQAIAHLNGAQLSLVHKCAFGPSEPDDGTHRFMFQAHPNARKLVLSIVPYGYPSGPDYGTIGAFGVGREITDAQADLANPYDIPEASMGLGVFVGDITPGGFQEIVWDHTDIRPHSVLAYEARRSLLSGSDEHVDRSVADPRLFITDDADRGAKACLSQLEIARINSRRHPISFAYGHNSGASDATAAAAWGTLYGPIACRARHFYDGVTTTPTEMVFYVQSIGAGTHSVRIRSLVTSNTGTLTGITTTGWKGSTSPPTLLAHGVNFDMKNDGWDVVMIEAQRTAGAGTIAVPSVCVAENP